MNSATVSDFSMVRRACRITPNIHRWMKMVMASTTTGKSITAWTRQTRRMRCQTPTETCLQHWMNSGRAQTPTLQIPTEMVFPTDTNTPMALIPQTQPMPRETWMETDTPYLRNTLRAQTHWTLKISLHLRQPISQDSLASISQA